MKENNIIAFEQKEAPDNLYEMSLSQLKAHYAAMQQELALLNEKEPTDPQSDAYDQWADEHEELEDYLDEIMERMEELCS